MKSVKCRRAPRGRESGASLVEFALIVPVLVMILLGTITGGFALATKNSMTNSVREGARLGATMPRGPSWNAWADAVATRVSELGGSDLPKAQVCVAIVRVGASAVPLGSYPASTPASVSGACDLEPDIVPPEPPSNVAPNTCVVLVWGSRAATLETLVYSVDLTLEAKAVSRYERASECAT